MIINFVFLILFWPMAYNYIGTLGLFFYTVINFLPLSYGFFINQKIPNPKITKPLLFYFSYLLFIYFLGGLFFGNLSLESFRYVLLPLSFVSGVISWNFINKKIIFIDNYIFLTRLFIVINVISWYLIIIGLPGVTNIYTFYAAGSDFSESYISNVRFFGLAGQPAISAYLITFIWFSLCLSRLYRGIIFRKVNIKFPMFSFFFLLISIFSTFSRSAIAALFLSGLISYSLNYLKNFPKIKLSFKLTLNKLILFIFINATLFYTIPYFVQFSRFAQIATLRTALVRFKVYQIVVNDILQNSFNLLFGYFLNSKYMLAKNAKLYITDSNFAFILASTGLIGFVIFSILVFKLISNFQNSFSMVKNNFSQLNLFFTNWLIINIIIACIFDPPLLDAKCIFFIGLSLAAGYDIKQLTESKSYFLKNQT